jgi:predicted kinase
MDELSIQLKFEKGVYCVLGSYIDALATKSCDQVPEDARNAQQLRDNSHYHITVFTPSELSSIPSTETLCRSDLTFDKFPVYDIGISHIERGNLQCWYVVIYSPAIQTLRKQYGFQEKQLHITIGFYEQDIYGLLETSDLFQCISGHSNLSSLISCLRDEILSKDKKQPCCWKNEENPVSSLSFRQEKYLFNYVVYQVMEDASLESISLLKDIGKHLLSLCSSFPSIKIHYISLLEDIGWYLFPKGIFFGLKLLILILLEKGGKGKNNNGTLFYNLILPYFPFKISSENIQNISSFINNIIDLNHIILQYSSKSMKQNQKMILILTRGNTDGCCSYVLELVTLPRNFSFVPILSASPSSSSGRPSEWKQFLSGSSYPSSLEYLLSLYFVGIRHIVTIHENEIDIETQNHVNSIISQLHGSPSKEGKGKDKVRKTKKEVTKEASTPDLKESQYLSFHFINVNDRTPPSLDQMKGFISMLPEFFQKKESLLIHCQGGVGRTNTLIIGALMVYQGISYHEGFEQVESCRKITLSLSQQEFLRRWYAVIREDPMMICISENTSLCSSDSVSSSAVALSIVDYRPVASSLQMPPVIMFVGLPASGKSTFSKAMLSAFPDYFVRINRDEMRGKGECDNLLHQSLASYLKQERSSSSSSSSKKKGSNYLLPFQVILLDNCHVTKEKRKEWIEACHYVPIWCVFFQRSIAECKERILTREDHPTIKTGKAGCHIIDTMNKTLEIPTLKEGFQQVFTVTNDQEMEELLEKWKIPFNKPTQQAEEEENQESDFNEKDEITGPSFVSSSSASSDSHVLDLRSKPIKFPKIPHLINLGSATRDDKILSSSDLKTWIAANHHFIIEEKIDGANLGIWIYAEEEDDEEKKDIAEGGKKDGNKVEEGMSGKKEKRYKNYQIMIQNRSHYINQYYHKQFEKIHYWIEQHKYELYSLLIPNETILYGEWVYAKHSISYDSLPDFFIAYDLFSISSGSFLSRYEMVREMEEKASTISIVPLLFEGKISSAEQVLSLVKGKSAFSTTDNREGIVIRVHSNLRYRVNEKIEAPVKGKSSTEAKNSLKSSSLKSCDVKDERDNIQLLLKCKIVREQFIAGNDRWNNSHSLALNSLLLKR